MNISNVLFISGGKENEGIIMLVDSQSNHFVLSKPTDSTITHVDHILLMDIMFVTVLSAVLGILGMFLSVPSMFTSVLAGMILGPSGKGYLTVSYNNIL